MENISHWISEKIRKKPVKGLLFYCTAFLIYGIMAFEIILEGDHKYEFYILFN